MTPTRRQLLAGLAGAAGLAVTGCSPGDDSTSPTPTVTGPRSSASAAARASAGGVGVSPRPSPPSPLGTAAPRSPGGPAPEVGSGPARSPQVALTFHGAGDRRIARAVLAELATAGVHVTVLAVGTWLSAQPDVARHVLDGGHELGNHTQRHLPMRQLGAAQAYAEIVGCRQELLRLTGSPGHWFRASGTQHTTSTIRRAAGRAGYAACLSYDVDSLDWTDPGASAVVRTVKRLARNGSIISLHLGHAGTVPAIEGILAGLSSNGLRPVTVSELLS